MFIDQLTMDKIHEIQIEMWKTLSGLLESMQIPYYFVHGSLLGAVRDGGFIPEDDDIDIAVFRKDFEKLMSSGNSALPGHYFLQYSLNDDFPLAFGKFRDSRTAFIQPGLNGYHCNKGIYIDIFPIDYVYESALKRKWFQARMKLLNYRINSRMYSDTTTPKKIFGILSKILVPSYESAVKKREKLFDSLPISSLISVTNGKPAERMIPLKWFEDQRSFPFCGFEISGPSHYEDYLRTIYGENFYHHNPADSRLLNGTIEISADILSFDQSYQKYV